jgi:hypothetical protein
MPFFDAVSQFPAFDPRAHVTAASRHAAPAGKPRRNLVELLSEELSDGARIAHDFDPSAVSESAAYDKNLP